VPDFRMPLGTYLGEWLPSIVLGGGSPFLIRIFRERRPSAGGKRRVDGLRTLIVGAGDAGDSLLRDMQRAPDSKWIIEGFLDDNLGKTGAMVRDIRILGPADEATLSRLIPDLDIKLVVLAIPTADGARLRQIVELCRKSGVQTKTMPSLADRIEGQLPLAALREIA